MTKICPSARVKLSKNQQVKTRLVNLRLEDDSGLKAGGSASRPEAVNPHTSSSDRMNHSQHITSHRTNQSTTGMYESRDESSDLKWCIQYVTVQTTCAPASKRLSLMHFLSQWIGPVEQQSESQTALLLNFCSLGCVSIVMGYFHASYCD